MTLIQWFEAVALRGFLAFTLREKKGATAVEYGLMVALIAIVIVASVVLIGTGLNNVFATVADCLKQLNAAGCPTP